MRRCFAVILELVLSLNAVAQVRVIQTRSGAGALPAPVHVASGQGFCLNGTKGGGITGTCVGSGTSTTFSYTPNGTGNGMLFVLGCGALNATPSAVSLTATGWTFTQVGSIIGSTATGFMALYKAYAPNTSAASIAVSWTVSTGGCGDGGAAVFMNALTGEFSGANATNFVDVSNSASAASTTSCNSVSVTPTVDNTILWSGCNDNQTAAGSGWTKGADDTQSDIAVYKSLSGGSGVSQSPGFGSSTGTSYTVFMVAVKP